MKKVMLLAFAGFTFLSVKAQEIDGLEAFLLAKDDSEKLMEAYISPVMKGLVYGMNGGWYHTAKVHKKFGFDITIGASAAKVPSSDEVFSLAALSLTNTVTSANDLIPTVAGDSREDNVAITVPLTYEGNTVYGTANVTFPGGIKGDLPLNAVPTPLVQIGVGLPVVNSDVMLRFVPSVGSDDVKGSVFGIGVKHDLMQYLGPLDRLPLHLAVLAGYTSMKVNYDMSDSGISGVDQEAVFKLNSFTVQAIASLNFPFINFYGGIGYNGGNSSIAVEGDYILEYTTATTPQVQVSETITDPVDFKVNAGGVRGTLGVRLSMGAFKIFGDYTVQKYNVISAGIAVSIR